MEIVSSTEMKAASRYKWRMAHPKRHRAIVFVPYYNNQCLKKKKKKRNWPHDRRPTFTHQRLEEDCPSRLPTLCSPLTHAIDKGRAAVPNSLNQCDERKNKKKKTRRSQHFLIATYLMPKPEWVQWSSVQHFGTSHLNTIASISHTRPTNVHERRRYLKATSQ